MANPQVAERGELSLGSFNFAAVLAAILDKASREAIGARAGEIAYATGMTEASARETAEVLEANGYVVSKPLQTGTGGTTSRFYTPVPGVSIVVYGPPGLNKLQKPIL